MDRRTVLVGLAATAALSSLPVLGRETNSNNFDDPVTFVENYLASVSSALNAVASPAYISTNDDRRLKPELLNVSDSYLSDSDFGASTHSVVAQRLLDVAAWRRYHARDFSSVSFGSRFSGSVSENPAPNVVVVTGTETVSMDLTIGDAGPTQFSPEKRKAMEQLRRQGGVYEIGSTVPSSYTVGHKVTLSLQGGGRWFVEKDETFVPTVGVGVRRVTPRIPKTALALHETNAAPMAFGATTNGAPSGKSVNRTQAARYADTWCNEGPNLKHGYNPAYKNWQAQDTDCANFVSQCYADASAGQLPTTTSWQSYNGNWVGARGLYEYMKGYIGINWQDGMDHGTADNYQRRYLFPADILCYYSDKHHVAIVVAWDANGNCYYDAHTNDRFHNLWDAFEKVGPYNMLHVASRT